MESEENKIATLALVSGSDPSIPSAAYPRDIWADWEMHNSLTNAHSSNDSKLSPLTDESPHDTSKLPKKRGRRPLRPFDPIKKKTEEKDKYWLRSFRSYMKFNYSKIEHTLNIHDKIFLQEYLSSRGKPDKVNKYLSYGKKYKDYLFSHQIFTSLYREWFKNYGHIELSKKCKAGSDLWFVYYDYASKDLFNYTVVQKAEEENKKSESSSQGQLNESMMIPDLGIYYFSAFLSFFGNNNDNMSSFK
ncbi:unnamed protein product [Blepharisma stoltei]|uniref:Uncharacterized protein n=1 Tax=Blepharisma stoltei TaxID=1481888 RepID=A0AAU9KDV9_9CILI|nr:unnamed protein product [Blepharisma stoltei]